MEKTKKGSLLLESSRVFNRHAAHDLLVRAFSSVRIVQLDLGRVH